MKIQFISLFLCYNDERMLSHSNAEICVHLGYTKDKIIKPTDGSNATGVAPLFFPGFFYCCYSNKIVAVIGGVRLNGPPGKLRPSKIFTLKPISCEKRLRLMPRQNPGLPH